jgi:methylene-tetrahydrofolate reductase-like protein
MITITEAKPPEEIEQMLAQCQRVFLVGCGTCTTMLRTGGKTEVLGMKAALEEKGKTVTGWMVIPTACDPLTREAITENLGIIDNTDCLLVLTCAFGVHTVGLHCEKPVYPALNTMFIGKDEDAETFIEVCRQCGNCILGSTAGICPLVRCAKSLLNGPCGGSVDGKCEVSPETPCAWQLIIDRWAALNMLDKFDEILPPRDWSTGNSGGPRRFDAGSLTTETGEMV